MATLGGSLLLPNGVPLALRRVRVTQTLLDSIVLLPALASSSRDDALAEVLDQMVAQGVVDGSVRGDIYARLVERENQASTGLGNGVAVPHVKQADVSETRIAVAVSSVGLPFDAIDGKPVHIVFLVLGPRESAGDGHLKALRWVSGLARSADFRRFARAIDGVDEFHELLVEMSGS